MGSFNLFNYDQVTCAKLKSKNPAKIDRQVIEEKLNLEQEQSLISISLMKTLLIIFFLLHHTLEILPNKAKVKEGFMDILNSFIKTESI